MAENIEAVARKEGLPEAHIAGLATIGLKSLRDLYVFEDHQAQTPLAGDIMEFEPVYEKLAAATGGALSDDSKALVRRVLRLAKVALAKESSGPPQAAANGVASVDGDAVKLKRVQEQRERVQKTEIYRGGVMLDASQMLQSTAITAVTDGLTCGVLPQCVYQVNTSSMQHPIQESRVGVGADGSSTMTLVVEGAAASGKSPSDTAAALMAVFRIQMTIHVNGWAPISPLVYDEAVCTHGRVRVGGVTVIYHTTFAECMAVYLWMSEAATRKTPPTCSCGERTVLNMRLGRSQCWYASVRVQVHHGAGAAADIKAP